MNGAWEPDNYDLTPGQCLESAVKRVLENPNEFTSCLVLLLNKEDGNYHLSRYASGLSNSEGVALFEYAKARLLQEMMPDV